MRQKKKSKLLKRLWNILYKHGWYKQKNVWKSYVETIVDNDGILKLNERHREEGLDDKNLLVTTVKYFSDHSKE